MEKAAEELFDAAKALLTYIDEAQVFDRLADAGCGLYDQYRSDRFDELLQKVKAALEAFQAQKLKK